MWVVESRLAAVAFSASELQRWAFEPLCEGGGSCAQGGNRNSEDELHTITPCSMAKAEPLKGGGGGKGLRWLRLFWAQVVAGFNKAKDMNASKNEGITSRTLKRHVL